MSAPALARALFARVEPAQQRLEAAALAVASALGKVAEAEAALSLARRALLEREGALLLEGAVSGRNQAERDAHLSSLTSGERLASLAAEGVFRLERLWLEVAPLEPQSALYAARSLETAARPAGCPPRPGPGPLRRKASP